MEEINLRRSSSTTTAPFRPNPSPSSSSKVLPSHHNFRSSSSSSASATTFFSSRSSSINNTATTNIIHATSSSSSDKQLVPRRRSNKDNYAFSARFYKTRSNFSSLIRSLLSIITLPLPSISAIIPSTASCRWLSIPSHLSPSLGRKVTGTLFGHRRGHVTFAVQDDSRSDPVLLIELATSTAALVKEMSSGLVRIALECEKIKGATTGQSGKASSSIKLFQEPVWTMYCNGRKCGYAMSRACTDFDWYVLSTIQSVSVGAGVIPLVEGTMSDGGGGDVGAVGTGSIGSPEGELLYMRAKFERVVGSRDSEAFYMMNPDGNGGPELSIFLLRV